MPVLIEQLILQIVQMNMAYNEPEGGQPIEEVFSEKEVQCLKLLNDKLQGTTQKLKNNNDQSKLKWATWIIARLSG